MSTSTDNVFSLRPRLEERDTVNAALSRLVEAAPHYTGVFRIAIDDASEALQIAAKYLHQESVDTVSGERMIAEAANTLTTLDDESTNCQAAADVVASTCARLWRAVESLRAFNGEASGA
jgi:hypothetical protein